MKTIYIAVKHWDEVYNSFIDFFGDSKEIIQRELNHWEDSEHRMGNAASSEIMTFDIDEDIVEAAQKVSNLGAKVTLIFQITIDATDSKGNSVVPNPDDDGTTYEDFFRVRKILRLVPFDEYMATDVALHPLKHTFQECYFVSK